MASEQAEYVVSMMQNRAMLSPQHFYRGLSDAIDEATEIPRLLRVEAAARELYEELRGLSVVVDGGKSRKLAEAEAALKAALSEGAKT